jgi:2-oxoglutarate dehydrogenase E2 component (dihydrolipoamide succinyltransferase)
MDIKVPALGESVTEATVARWLKQLGEAVKRDEPVVELETDKVTLEVNAPADGVLSEIIVAQGTLVKVGNLVGRIGEKVGGTVESSRNDQTPGVSDVKSTPVSDATLPASPAARKLMAEAGLTPENITGTGKSGMIIKDDVVAFQSAGSPHSVGAAPASGGRETRQPMSRLRQRIAERLKQAQNTAAILTTFNEVDMTAVMTLRDQYKDAFEKKYGVKLGFMSFFVKACVNALKELPAVNAEISGADVIYKHYYDIGVAVGTPMGLVVPVLRDAENKDFAAIEKEINQLGTKAREGKLTVDELSGGTFTISNGGVYGSLMSTPILNPPQSAILGMHKIQKRAVVINDKIEIRPMMYLALSYDHRIIDGREAVTFLVRIKECIEDPQRLLMGI